MENPGVVVANGQWTVDSGNPVANDQWPVANEKMFCDQFSGSIKIGGF
jgi:hypothetical protein